MYILAFVYICILFSEKLDLLQTKYLMAWGSHKKTLKHAPRLLLLSPLSSSPPAPAGRGEPAEPHDGELNAVRLEDASAGPQATREQQAPLSWAPVPFPRPDTPVCRSCLGGLQPLLCKEPVGQRGGGKVRPHGSESREVPGLIQGPAPPLSSPPDQELRPAQRPSTAAAHLQNGFLSHLGGSGPAVGQRSHGERRRIRDRIRFHCKLLSASGIQPWAHSARRRGSSSRWHPAAPPLPPG